MSRRRNRSRNRKRFTQRRKRLPLLLPLLLVGLIGGAFYLLSCKPSATNHTANLREVAQTFLKAMRADDLAAMKANACDLLPGWSEQLPAFAQEAVASIQSVGGDPAALEKIDALLIEEDYGCVQTVPLQKPHPLRMTLYFARTLEGWRNFYWTSGTGKTESMEPVSKELLERGIGILERAFGERARVFLTFLSEERFREAHEMLAPAIQSSATEKTLAEIWHRQADQHGLFESIDLEHVIASHKRTNVPSLTRGGALKKAPVVSIQIPTVWERARVPFHIVFDLQGRLIGFASAREAK